MNSKSPQTSPKTCDQKIFDKISLLLEEKKGLKSITPKGSKGGYGYVLFVQDIKTNLKYAVKAQSIIDEMNGGIDNDKNEMCKQESEILKSINHKNVVEYHSDYTINYYHFIQMNLCECSLDDWIQKRGNNPISNSLFLHFLNQILDGIEHLHSLNYVLRDLSTRNILISTDGTIKLCDFGLAKKIESNNMQTSIQSNSVKGTFAYHPPELMKEFTSKSKSYSFSKSGDIWALGICLSLLGGSSFIDIINLSQSDLKSSQVPLLNNDCYQIIQFILNKNPKERPSVSSIRKFIFDQLSSGHQEQTQNQSNQLFKIQEDIDNFYNNREIDIDITKYLETEKDCLKSLNKIESLIKLGYVNLYYYNNFDKAYQYFIDALQINQNDPDIYLGLSQILLEKWVTQEKKSDKIDYYIEKASQISPNYWRVQFLKFQKCYLNQENKLALQYLNKSMEIKQNHPLLITFKYQLQSLQCQDETQKEQVLKQFINESFPTKYRLYYRYIGQMAFKLQKYEKSNEYFFQELKYFPKNELILNNIGTNYKRMNQFEQALKYYKQALEINPLFVAAKDNISKIIRQTNKQQ